MSTYPVKCINLILIAVIFLIVQPPLLATEDNRKEAVKDTFIAWEKGEGSPFSLLREDATWEVLGSTKHSQSYTIPQLRKQVIDPFNARLVGPLKPRFKDIFQDGDTIIILFEATGKMINGETYNNTYTWFFSMDGSHVIHVKAVLDMTAFEHLMSLKID